MVRSVYIAGHVHRGSARHCTPELTGTGLKMFEPDHVVNAASMSQQTHEKGQDTVVVDNELENARKIYRPTRWQSNLTILSCVSTIPQIYTTQLTVQYIANFSDGFQNSLANPTNVIFKQLLGTSGYPSEMQTRISNALLIGAILGVVALGYISDMTSRRAGLLFTSGLVTIATLMSALALQVHPTHNMLWYFVIVRGICGFGVGGEYPPSAAAGIEESDDVRIFPINLAIY